MVSERSLWQWLSKSRAEYPDDLFLQRIENSAGVGNPDVMGLYKGKYFFVELKDCKLPKKETTPLAIKVRPSQVDWHNDWQRAGGLSYFLIQAGNEKYLVEWFRWQNRKVTRNEILEISLVPPLATTRSQILTVLSINKRSTPHHYNMIR